MRARLITIEVTCTDGNYEATVKRIVEKTRLLYQTARKRPRNKKRRMAK